MEQHKARAAQKRARAQWVEKGEKNTVFSQPGKNRANAKIMESIKTDNRQIVTNQSGILHAKKKKKKNYFANVYKKKISNEN